MEHFSGTAATNVTVVDGENVCQLVSSSSDLDSNSFVMKIPRANSKLILQNMEEVLNSVKKKHRQKHKRKKELKRLAIMQQEKAEKAGKTSVKQQMIDDGSNSITKQQDLNNKFGECNGDSRAKKSSKKPLQEQQVVQVEEEDGHQSNGSRKGNHYSNGKRRKASLSLSNSTEQNVGVSTNGSDQHHVRVHRRSQEKVINVTSSSTQEEVEDNMLVEQKLTPTSRPSTNVFEVMMNARNKSIGSNTPGKEVNNSDGSPAASGTVNAKRKLLLQSWAERKGGLKRKLDDEIRGAYIEERLDDRAKRLKRMLTAGKGPRSSNTTPADTKKETQSNSTENRKSRKHTKSSIRKLERLRSTDSMESKSEKQPQLDVETVEFLSKLSSPTKKRDSLLGYFAKVPSPNESTGKPLTSTPVSKINLTKNDSSTPKRRGRPKSKQPTNSENLPTNDDVMANPSEKMATESQTPSTSTRPKRACRGKTKYDYEFDVEKSPKKNQAVDVETGQLQQRSKRKQRHASHNDTNDAEEVVTIDLESSTSFSILSSETKTPKKLAPLFVRSVPKPSVDPEALKARLEFLRSGVPDILKLEQDKQKLYDQNYEEALELFPKITHLQQWDLNEEKFLAKILSKRNTLLFKKFSESINGTSDSFQEAFGKADESGGGTGCGMGDGSGRKAKATKGRSTAFLGITNCTVRDFKPDKKLAECAISLKCSTSAKQSIQSANFSILNNKRLIIKAWKADFDRFPTFKCYNQLRTKYRFFSAMDSTQDTEQVTESFVVTRNTRRSLEPSPSMSSTSLRNSDSCPEDDVKPPATAPNGELLFTEKYKPMLFEQVLVNVTPVSQLRDFLATWANGSGSGNGNGSASGSARNSQNLLDDSMDFMNDSNSSQPAICNSVVLLGPASSGKTNAVFTLANEMNFNVLEINAGMKRTGKKLIQELLEATQSHQIRNESSGGAAVKSKAQKNLLKMSLNSLKGKKKAGPNNSNVNETELVTEATDLNVRKCLILIEDADIVFDQTDAGFTDAVYMLAASSKRPVIVIATNPNCQHLQRLMAQNTIKFTAPNVLSISKYLAVLSLMENCPISLDDLISLYLYNQHDLRKTLHELQFFIQSGGDHKRQPSSSRKTSNFNGNNSVCESNIQCCQQKTPQKETVQCNKSSMSGKYFASPGKQRLPESEDSQSQFQIAVHDEQLKRETNRKDQTNTDDTYLHRTLFEFYTVDQNLKWRVPFPVNFDLFYVNLSDILGMARKLKPPTENDGSTTKRKTRSPKKIWLSAATAQQMTTSSENQKFSQSPESLNALSSFYNNLSISNLMAARGECVDNRANGFRYERDRLMPYLSESIAHDLLEQAIKVDLEAELCPYNLFDGKKESATISDQMGPTMMTIPKRSRLMDFEPTLREICRSEKQRASQERRSTRFYHYLRSSCADICNFSQRPFDEVCCVFQSQHQQQTDEVQAKE